MARNSLGELVARFEQLGKDTAYRFRRGLRMQRWSYGELASCAQRFAHELATRGIVPGDRVLIWAPNCAEWVAAFFGCVLCGAVVVPMDVAAARDFAIRVAREVDAKLVVGSRQQSLPGIPHIAVEDLATIVANHPPKFEAFTAKRSDTLEIIFTSGTTSDPRGVVITHGNVLANLEPLEAQIAKYLRYERWFHPLRLLDLLPLSHVFGQFLGIFVPQSMGATVVFHDTLNPGEIMRLIKRERVSACICVPRMLQSLRQQVENMLEERGELQSLRENIARSENEKFMLRWWRFRK
ncbi:MAG TPA: AMP-binding protein, partial [Terriglobales bacterium]